MAEFRSQRTDLPPVPADVFCPDCGYDLHGLTGARCPECGFDLETVRAQAPQIPWARRREIGWRSAYWQTVWATLRPRRFCMEMVRPISYRDSQLFRWITFAHCSVCGARGHITHMVLADSIEVIDRNSATEAIEQTFILLAWFAALPGLASYVFHKPGWPVEQQNRALALSYYAWGHLAWVAPVWLVLGLVVAWLVALVPAFRGKLTPFQASVTLVTGVGLAAGATLLFSCAPFLRHITRRGRVACIFLCALMALAAAALFALLHLLRLVLLWLCVVVVSLQ